MYVQKDFKATRDRHVKEKSMRKPYWLFRSTALFSFPLFMFRNFCWDVFERKTHNIKDYHPESKPRKQQRNLIFIGWGRENRENGSKYLPFQFVYKFSTAPPRYGIQSKHSRIRSYRKRKTLISFKCLTHMNEDIKFPTSGTSSSPILIDIKFDHL